MDLSESETWSEQEEAVTGRPIAYNIAAGKPHAPSQSACQGRPKAEKTEWSYHLRVSPATNHHFGNSILDRQGDLRTRTR